MIDMTHVTERVWSTQREYLEAELLTRAEIGSADLIDAIRHQVYSGGKRLRAVLPYGTFCALTQTEHADEDACLWLGLCLELLHSGTLAHDDVMDGDRQRRNQPTVWVRFGTPQAINTGDILFYLAEHALQSAGLTPEQEVQASRWLSRGMRRVIHGQALEIQLRRDKILPDYSSYQNVVAGKTGGLFGLGLVFGAICSGRPPEDLEAFFSLGLELGSLFQIQDDVLDLIGSKGREQKGSDLLEGKPSWLIAHCVNNLSSDERALMRLKLYESRDTTTAEDVATMTALLEKTNTIERGLATLIERKALITEATQDHSAEFQAWITALSDRFLAPLSKWLPETT